MIKHSKILIILLTLLTLPNCSNANEQELFLKDRDHAHHILKSVLLTNSKHGLYVTHTTNLDNGDSNNIVKISLKFREFASLGWNDQDEFNVKYRTARIADTSSNVNLLVEVVKPKGQYITNLNKGMKYYVTAIASTDSGVELRKQFLIANRDIETNFITVNNEVIKFEPEKSVLLLIDFIIDNDDHNPRYHIVREFRKFGIPILHHMHEFLQMYGMSPILIPLGFSDNVVLNDLQTIENSLSDFGRENFDTIFVMGYGASVCALYTRPNSINHLVDKYPDKNIVVIEDGVDDGNYDSKWAISQYRDFAKSTRAIEILKSMRHQDWEITALESTNYLGAIEELNSEQRSGIERLSVDEFKQDPDWIVENITNTILIVSNLDKVSQVDVLDKIKKINKLYSELSLNIIEMNDDKSLLLNGREEKIENIYNLINDNNLVPVVTGYLNNDTPHWRAGFPADFYTISVIPHKIAQDSIFVRDVTKAKAGSPFSELGFTEEEALDVLINRASIYSDAKWIESDNF